MPSVLTPRQMFDLLPPDVDANGWLPIPGEGHLSPDLVVVKGYPNGWDAGANRPFMGKEGLPVRKVLVGQSARFYATCAFPFFRGKKGTTAKIARQATPVIAEEFRRLKPKKVLLMGADAARWTPGFDLEFSRFDQVLGRSVEINGTTYKVTYAPAAVAFDPSTLAKFELDVRSLLDPDSIEKPRTVESEQYRVFTNRLQAEAVLSRMGDRVAIDTEATGLDPYTARLLTIQFSWEEGIGYAVPWDMFTPAEYATMLAGKRTVFQNGSYDVKLLANHGLFLGVDEDAMILHSLLDENGSHAMEQMAQRYLGVDKWSEMVDYDRMEDMDLQTLGRYGARDADLTLRLANAFKPKTEGRHIVTVLRRGQNALIRSELRGVKIDRELAMQFREELDSILHDRDEYMADTYGLENANSPQQVARLLYDEMGIPTQREKGKVTTKEKFILPFADEHPVIRDVLEYRHLVKANSTYVKNILSASERDGRYHPNYKLASTETGRLTESLILLIPRPDELESPDLGKQYQIRLRELFCADEGYVMLGADYRGLEVGTNAYLSSDPQLISDYNTNLDTHSVVAIQAFDLGIELEPRATLKARVAEHHSYQRTLAKYATFSWLFGGTEQSIMRQLGIPLDVAADILAALRDRYQGVAEYQEMVKAYVREHGSFSTPWGRTRHFNFSNAVGPQQVEEQMREAINFGGQAMATDMNLMAFATLEGLGLQTLFPVHDAIYLQAPEDRAERVAKQVKDTMERVLPGPVLFEAEVHQGANWGVL